MDLEWLNAWRVRFAIQAKKYRYKFFYFPVHAAKNIWKKRFFEEKRKTAALDEQVNRLRHEVDAQHKTLMSYLENKGMLC